jgi:regulator of replication initiation timing
MSIQDRLENIRSKAEKLIEENTKLRLEYQQLLDEMSQLRNQADDTQKSIKDLENKNVNLQLSKTIDSNEKTKLKAVIEELIVEIDKGLELLKS